MLRTHLVRFIFLSLFSQSLHAMEWEFDGFRLEPLKPSSKAAFVKILSDVRYSVSSNEVITRKSAASIFAKNRHIAELRSADHEVGAFVGFQFTEIESGEAIGFITLYKSFLNYWHIGIVIQPEYQRRGLGKTAFKNLIPYLFDSFEMNGIIAITGINNFAAQKLWENYPFVKTRIKYTSDSDAPNYYEPFVEFRLSKETYQKIEKPQLPQTQNLRPKTIEEITLLEKLDTEEKVDFAYEILTVDPYVQNSLGTERISSLASSFYLQQRTADSVMTSIELGVLKKEIAHVIDPFFGKKLFRLKIMTADRYLRSKFLPNDEPLFLFVLLENNLVFALTELDSSVLNSDASQHENLVHLLGTARTRLKSFDENHYHKTLTRLQEVRRQNEDAKKSIDCPDTFEAK